MTMATSIKEKIITATMSFDDSSRKIVSAVGWRCNLVVLASTEGSVFIDGFVVVVEGSVDVLDAGVGFVVVLEGSVDVVDAGVGLVVVVEGSVDVVDAGVVEDIFLVVGSKR